ncbi:glycosyltransferase family 57 protein [Moniliophthora roreri]|nr:glycosyltransferase family 57 protein [Moniliophthora roreri]
MNSRLDANERLCLAVLRMESPDGEMNGIRTFKGVNWPSFLLHRHNIIDTQHILCRKRASSLVCRGRFEVDGFYTTRRTRSSNVAKSNPSLRRRS